MIRPMLAAQKYRSAGDLWGPLHEQVAQRHLDEDGYLIVQPKIDGMRCCITHGVARSRSWKPLGNKHLQQFAQDFGMTIAGLDCEVVPGHVYDASVFRQAMSSVRAAEGDPEMTLYVFDHMGFPMHGYKVRRAKAEVVIGRCNSDANGIVRFKDREYAIKLVLCPQIQVSTLEQLYEEERRLVELGWEGAIVRRHSLPYKFGRSTALGGELVKVKRRETIDVIITGYGPWEENQNEAKTSELGYTTRSSHQAGKVEIPRLGYWTVRRLEEQSSSRKQRIPVGPEFKVGVMRDTTHADRDRLWRDRDSYIGRYAEISIDGASGGYEAPRCPVLLRYRPTFEF